MALRRWLSQALDPEMRRGRGLSALNIGLVGLILVSVLVGILETEPALRDRFGAAFRALELVLALVFLAEYLCRVYVAPLNPGFRGVLAYLLRPAALVDLFVIIIMFLPFLTPEAGLLRLVRVLRLLRLARLGRFSLAMQMLGRAVASRGPELAVSLMFAGLVLLLASSALYLVEGPVQPEAFGSIPRAMWWAVTTLTTVGYGDAVPVTMLGRVLAGVTALCGVAIIALPTGLLAGAFSETMAEARRRRQAPPDDKTP